MHRRFISKHSVHVLGIGTPYCPAHPNSASDIIESRDCSTGGAHGGLQ